jgi:hypothetical protein
MIAGLTAASRGFTRGAARRIGEQIARPRLGAVGAVGLTLVIVGDLVERGGDPVQAAACRHR